MLRWFLLCLRVLLMFPLLLMCVGGGNEMKEKEELCEWWSYI